MEIQTSSKNTYSSGIDCGKSTSNTLSLIGSQKSSSSKDTTEKNIRKNIQALLNNSPKLHELFDIHEKIGEGSFSSVYLGTLKGINNDKKFAIKHLTPTTHPKRIQVELECLTLIGGRDNIVSCELTIRKADCIVFIMPYFQHNSFSSYVMEMSVEEMRQYMKNLFLALRRVHSFNVIHRDVKPSNFLYNRATKKYLLVDFGLSQKLEKNDTNQTINTSVSINTAAKRKREDDDLENVEKPAVKRLALQTLPNDMINKQLKLPQRYSKQPLSAQQRKFHESYKGVTKMFKRHPLTSHPSNIIDTNDSVPQQKQEFQCLLPLTGSPESGSSFVRVQNSQVQTSLFPRPTAPVRRKECDCNGKSQLCHTCISRKLQHAPRAGTPGFRPPEVLLKYTNQTTAVDMWAAGVMMLCLTSGCYPFFRAPDDVTALSEFISVFGTSAITSIAKKLGRNVICSEQREPLNLQILCENLRRRRLNMANKNSCVEPESTQCEQCCQAYSTDYGCLCEEKTKLNLSNSFFPRSAYDLLSKLLDLDPNTRISAEQALQHPFITGSQ